VVANLGKGWQEVNKHHRQLMWKYLKKQLNELEFRKQYPIKIFKKSAASENYNDRDDINWTWENITVNINISTK